MKRIPKLIIALALVLFILPAWLYASGNLPPLFAGEQRFIWAVQHSYPELARATYKTSHRALEKLRDLGINVPYTYNERLLRVKVIRDEVIEICNGMIMDI